MIQKGAKLTFNLFASNSSEGKIGFLSKRLSESSSRQYREGSITGHSRGQADDAEHSRL